MKSWQLGLVGLIALGVAHAQEGGAGAEARQEALLKRAPELQQIAKEYNGGARGCGMSMATLVTSKGPLRIRCGGDTTGVFGSTIEVADLIALLQARSESNESGEGPMAGEVGDLCYVVLATLQSSQDPKAIEPIAALLTDEDDVIRGWAVIALLNLAKAEGLQAQIAEIEFPQAALLSASSRGVEAPEWVKRSD